MKILFSIMDSSSSVTAQAHLIASKAPTGIEVEFFPVNLPGRRLRWRELDLAWRCGDHQLHQLHERLCEAAVGCDVFLNYNGRNVHPDMLKSLQTFNVYGFFDDPESHARQALPLAPYYDAVFYGNITADPLYEYAKCPRRAWLPIFTSPIEVPTHAQSLQLLDSTRDNDIVFVGGLTGFRRKRLQKLSDAFPQARCYGTNWQQARIDDEQLKALYQRTKIGWNIHNSTGPINSRMFSLAAWGVLQLCDNRTGLGEIFRLGEEVIGFDTIDQAIDATRYYLAHDDERRRITTAACKRYWNEYHAQMIWQRIVDQLRKWGVGDFNSQPPQTIPTVRPRIGGISPRLIKPVAKMVSYFCDDRTALARFGKNIDERFYCGVQVELESVIADSRSDGVNTSDTAAIRDKVLSWSAIGLIGSAQRISVINHDGGQWVKKLAQQQPGRNVQVVSSLQNHTESLGDLCICFGDSIDDVLIKKLTVDRLIWAIPAVGRNQSKRLAMRLSKLKQMFESVAIYRLPHALVPWIEPATRPSTGLSLLAVGQTPKEA